MGVGLTLGIMAFNYLMSKGNKGDGGGGGGGGNLGRNLAALGPVFTTILPGLMSKNMIGKPNINAPPELALGPSTYREGNLGRSTERFLSEQVRTPGAESRMLPGIQRTLETTVRRQIEPQLQRIRDNSDLSEGQKIDLETRLRREASTTVASAMSDVSTQLEAQRTAGVFKFLQGEAMEEAERARIIQREMQRLTDFELGKEDLKFRRDMGQVQAMQGGFQTGAQMAKTLAEIYSMWKGGGGS